LQNDRGVGSDQNLVLKTADYQLLHTKKAEHSSYTVTFWIFNGKKLIDKQQEA